MAYLFDYAKKMKNKTFEDSTFNEVDGVIFALMSLIDVTGVVPKFDESPQTFKEVIDKQISLHGMKAFGFVISLLLTKFFNEIKEYRRFKDLLVCDGVNIIDEELETQSTFFSVILPDGTRIMICGGTDDSIVGWKEDFNLMIKSVVPCLDYSVDYLERISLKSQKIIIVGHSKGGMESLYALAFASKQAYDKVGKAISYDGPGYHIKVISDERFFGAIEKMRLYVPEGGTVGRLFYNPLEPIIVPSKYHGLQQHDPLSWAIEDKKFKRTNKFTTQSNEIKLKVDEIVNQTPKEEKKKFVKNLFDILEAGGSKCLFDVTGKPHRALIAYLQLKPEDKTLINSLLAKLVKDKVIAKELMLGMLSITSD